MGYALLTTISPSTSDKVTSFLLTPPPSTKYDCVGFIFTGTALLLLASYSLLMI
jgi:hypothetical protein